MHFSVLSLIFLLPVYLILTLPYSSFSLLLYQCTDNIYLSILFFFFVQKLFFSFLKDTVQLLVWKRLVFSEH